jgi:phosphatidylserine/phosphatidylglycerophosphate/cardiolipin synthase-like enzyme
VTIDEALDTVLGVLSDSQAIDLAVWCASAASPSIPPLAGASPAAHSACADLRAAWMTVPNLTGAGLALAVRAGLRARRARDATASRPVWTGPGSKGEQRLTAAQLVGLIGSASERVLVVSYAAYTVPEIADALAAAVPRCRTVDAVFETTEDSSGAYSGPTKPFAAVPGLRRWRWPAVARPDGGAALHAKLLVVDGRRALIGSANLTDRALHKNLEAGLLVRDPDVAAALEHHVRQLMVAGILRQV